MEHFAEENKILSSFQKLMLQLPYAIAIYRGNTYRIELANETAFGVLVKDKGCIGQLLFEAMPELELPIKAIFDEVMQSGIPFHANEMELSLNRNGKNENAWFNINCQPILEDASSVSGILVSAHEVTDQVIAKIKLVESEFRYHNMIRTSSSLISILKGEEMIIEIANDAILESWGKGRDIFGKSLFEVLPETVNQGFDKTLLNVYKTGIPFFAYDTPVTLVRNDKRDLVYYTFAYHAQRNAKGEIDGVAIIANEVTEQFLAKRKIEESERRFRSLADNIPLNVFILEPSADASVSYWNKNWLDYTGQTIEEALGRTWEGNIHPDDVQPILDIYVSAFKTQKPFSLPSIRVKRYDGIYRWFAVQANPRLLPNGEFIGFIGVGFDIHEQKLAQDELKLSEEHFRLLADLMPAKISNSNPEGSVTYFNKHWLDFTGCTFEDLIEFGYHKIIHPDEVEEFKQRFQKAAKDGSDLVMEMRFKNKQGDYIWHLNIASPIKDKNNKLKMWISVATEMQHQKEQREELEHAVAKRTQELSIANEGLKKTNIELEAFTYVSSHDLQEPLRKIQTFAGLILERENQNLSENGKIYFAHMQNSAQRMQMLIQNLLAFSHLSTAERKFEFVDLTLIIEDVKKEFKEAIAEKNAVIEVREICMVRIIPFQFRQLMQNLVGNALKFSNPKIPPHIIIESHILKYDEIKIANLPFQKEYCHISISDNGIGFEKEFAEKIFEVFQKLHGKDEYAGTGIGLAIVKKIVDNHKGVVTATSVLHEGTTFNVYLPTL